MGELEYVCLIPEAVLLACLCALCGQRQPSPRTAVSVMSLRAERALLPAAAPREWRDRTTWGSACSLLAGAPPGLPDAPGCYCQLGDLSRPPKERATANGPLPLPLPVTAAPTLWPEV